MTQDTHFVTSICIDNLVFSKMKRRYDQVQTLDNGTEVIILRKLRGTKNDCVFYELVFIFAENGFNFEEGLSNLISIYQKIGEKIWKKVSEFILSRTCFLKLRHKDDYISLTTHISDEDLTKWLEKIAQNLGLERSKIYVLTGGTVGKVMRARDDVERMFSGEGWESLTTVNEC